MNCPNCGKRQLIYEVIDDCLWLKCVCGKLVPMVVENGELTPYEVAEGSVARFPREGTKLHMVLELVVSSGSITSGEAGVLVGMPAEEIATHLTVLESRGFVVREVLNRGVKGGSTWCASDYTLSAFKG
jgi:hypothetical protein